MIAPPFVDPVSDCQIFSFYSLTQIKKPAISQWSICFHSKESLWSSLSPKFVLDSPKDVFIRFINTEPQNNFIDVNKLPTITRAIHYQPLHSVRVIMQFGIFFLILIISNFLHFISNNCSHKLIVYSIYNNQYNDSTNFSFEDFSFLDDSKSCDQLLNNLLSNEQNNEGKGQIPNCKDELIEVNLMPYSVFPEGENILPHVKLNLSLAARSSEINEIFFRFRCLYAPNMEDYLCHKHEILIQKWGKMIWPCRRLKFGNYFKNKSNLAIFFSYTCYNLFSLSQYLLDIFVLKSQERTFCRKTILLTIPLERQLDPKISHFYTGVGKWNELIQQNNLALWSPLLYVDFSYSDEILVNLSPINWIWPLMDINLLIFSVSNLNDFSLHNNNKTNIEKHFLLANEKIHPQFYNNNSLMKYWRKYLKNIDSGKYIIYAFIDNNQQCVLVCDDNSFNIKQCIKCPHTVLNFTLFESKYSNHWKIRKILILIGKFNYFNKLFSLFCIFFFFCTLGYNRYNNYYFLFVRFWRLKVIQTRQPQSIELTKRPNILILYTDDCQEHINSVMALCKILEENANAKCFIDQKEFLQNPTVRPGVWLTEKIDECDFVLTIFSECSQKVISGFIAAKINEIVSKEGLIQNGIISQKCSITKRHKPVSIPKNGEVSQIETNSNSSLSKLSQFAFARFSYSPSTAIPSFFTSTLFCAGFGPLILPQHIGPLIAWIHGILNFNNKNDLNIAERNDRFEHQADLSPLNDAIEEYKRFVLDNPNWLNERFNTSNDKIEDEQDNSTISNELSINNQNLQIPNLVEIAERFGLLGLDENDDELIDENNSNINDTGLPRSLNSQRIGQKRYELIGRLEDYDTHYILINGNLNMGGFKGLKNCKFCEYKHKLTSMVRRHERQSHALECTIDECGAKLSYNRMAKHVREKHCLNNSMEKSSELEKITSNSNGINQEQLTKEEQFTDLSLNLNKSAASGEFLCSCCDKLFKNRYSLRKHFNLKKHQCTWPSCSESFTCESKLEGHLNAHKGEKPYECEHCGKSFSKYHLINIRHFNEQIGELLDSGCITNIEKIE
ncbi:SEFIR domain-containing protein [Meloidogyne graminicola]|uniref:SEFIR domain-containing protein n=1 Tax=Meloidogyne graminicola TaxID=189291 RepID=A0A8T0A2Z5_9BILA|nr:SEFIR domain-containing protein [Meloidogyne graminicola]